MKNLTKRASALLLTLLGVALLSAAQVKLTPIGSATNAKTKLHRAANDRQPVLILEEDFSKFEAGTEDVPDTKNTSNNQTGVILSKFTKMPGWTGAGVRQAGGTCAIAVVTYAGDSGPESGTGFLMTPLGNYAGDLTMTFRARLWTTEEGTDQMAVMIVSKEVGVLEDKKIEVGKEWKNYTLTFSKGEFANCAIEMFMQSKAVQIDDIKVTSVQTSIIPPVVLDATNYTGDSFIAHWEPTEEAESYLFSLYKKETAAASVKQNFETIKATANGLMDKTNSVIPEGWTIGLDHGNSKLEVAAEGVQGGQALIFDETNDFVTTPKSEKPIRDLTLFVKNLNKMPCASRLYVQVLEGDQWFILGAIDIERISAEGEVFSLANKLEANVYQVSFAFEKSEADKDLDVAIALSNISYMTEPDNTPVISDKEVTGTSFKAELLDPESDYSYTVKAKNATFTSANSREKLVLDLTAPIPAQAKVTDNGYIAYWQPTPKADGYYVRNFKVLTLPEAQESVLLEEDFSKVTDGTLSAPVGLYNISVGLLDKYDLTQQPGWMGLCNYKANGMLGGFGSFFGKGLLQTPTMKLDGNNGKFKVEIIAYGVMGAAGDSLVVQAGANVFKRFFIPEDEKPVHITTEFDCGEADMALLLYTYRNTAYMIDYIKVSQELPAGTKVITEASNDMVWGNGNTSYEFTNLTQEENETFGFRVFAHRWYRGQEIYSVSNEMPLVDLNQIPSGLDKIEKDFKVFTAGNKLHIVTPKAETVRVYDINGRCHLESQAIAGMNIYNISNKGIYLVKVGNNTAKVIIR